MNQENKKISLAEAVIMILIVGSADLLDVVVDLAAVVPVVGEFLLILNSLINIAVTFIIQLWLRIKGIRGQWALVGNLLEFIPLVNILPMRTMALISTIIMTNRGVSLAPPKPIPSKGAPTQ